MASQQPIPSTPGSGPNPHPLSALVAALATPSQQQPLAAFLPQIQTNPMLGLLLQSQALGQTSALQQLLNPLGVMSGAMHVNSESLLQQLVMLLAQTPAVPTAGVQNQGLQAATNTQAQGTPTQREQTPGDTAKLDTLAGKSQGDEQICIDALISRRAKGLSARQVLEALHGVNNHTAGSWKDYYLENQDHIDARIADQKSREEEQTIANSKKPVPPAAPQARDDGSTPQSRMTASRANVEAVEKRLPTSVRQQTAMVIKSTKSREKQSEAQTSRSRKPNSSKITRSHVSDKLLNIPPPPSRSPTPPPCPNTNVRGKGVSDVETDYLVRSIQWQLQQNPSASLHSMARRLADKLPTRSCNGWTWVIGKTYRKTVDQLIIQAGGQEEESEPESEDDQDDQDGADDEDDGWDDQELEYPTSDNGENEHPDSKSADFAAEDVNAVSPANKQAQMRAERIAIDIHFVAKFLADSDLWESDCPRMVVWRELEAKNHDRSAKSWAEFYRRHRLDVDYRILEYKQASVPQHEDEGADDSGTDAASVSMHKRKRLEESSREPSESHSIPLAKKPKIGETEI